jgi:pimeloyl-ACP methyl ester carboxylesterase
MSLGGYLSQLAALTHPEQIRSLTLIGSEPLGWDGDPLPHISPQFMAHFEAMAQLDWSDRSAVRALLLESDRLCAGSHYPFDAEEALRRIDADIDRSPSIASALNHGQITSTGTWDGAFRKITQPTLVIHGEQDPILPLANGQALADGIPNARLLVLDGVGHELPTPALPQIIAAISAFLSDCPA